MPKHKIRYDSIKGRCNKYPDLYQYEKTKEV